MSDASTPAANTPAAKPQRFDALGLAQRIEGGGDEGRALYICDRNLIYPAVLAAIAAGVKATPHGGDEDDERYDDEGEADARHWNAQLAAGRKQMWFAPAVNNAMLPRDQMDPEKPQLIGWRALILELARGWFTNELHRAAWRVHGDAGIHVRWTETRPTDAAGNKLPSPWRL